MNSKKTPSKNQHNLYSKLQTLYSVHPESSKDREVCLKYAYSAMQYYIFAEESDDSFLRFLPPEPLTITTQEAVRYFHYEYNVLNDGESGKMVFQHFLPFIIYDYAADLVKTNQPLDQLVLPSSAFISRVTNIVDCLNYYNVSHEECKKLAVLKVIIADNLESDVCYMHNDKYYNTYDSIENSALEYLGIELDSNHYTEQQQHSELCTTHYTEPQQHSEL